MRTARTLKPSSTLHGKLRAAIEFEPLRLLYEQRAPRVLVVECPSILSTASTSIVFPPTIRDVWMTEPFKQKHWQNSSLPIVLRPSRSHYGCPSVCLRSCEANTYFSMSSRTQDCLLSYGRYLEVADLKVERCNVELQFDSTPCSNRLTNVL